MPGKNRTRFDSRISRRSALRGAAAGSMGLAAASLLACGPSSQPSGGSESTVASKQPKRGGTLTYFSTQGGIWTEGLDPHVLRSSNTGRMRMFYETLVREHPKTAELEAELAQRWEQPTETQYVFHLQPGVKWHNKAPLSGRELTVQDVVFSLDRLRTNDPRFQNRQALGSVDKIEAVDKSTVRVTTKTPDVTVMRALAGFSLVILAPEVIEKTDGKITSPDTAIGTGAFILQQFDDVSSLQVRNPDYWRSGYPLLDAVRMQNFKDDQGMWSAFIGNQLHLAQTPGSQAKKTADDAARKFQIDWFPDVGFQGMYSNVSRKPFDDVRVAKALRLLIDHDDAVKSHTEVWHGRGRISSVLPSSLADWDFTEEEYRSRFLEYKQPKTEAVAEALRLLSGAGFTRDNPLRFQLMGSTLGGWYAGQQELLQSQYNRSSQGVINAELRPLETAAMNQSLTRGDFEVAMAGMVAPFPEVDAYPRNLFYTNGGRNYGKFSDSKFDQMLDRQRMLFDVAQRKIAVKEIVSYAVENGPYSVWAGRYILNSYLNEVKEWFPEGELHAFGHQYQSVWLDI